MKTVFITTSKKTHRAWANSSYFAWLTRLWCGRDKQCIHLRGKGNYKEIIEACREAEALVIAMPIYVDAIPAHVLQFLTDMEEEAKTWHCKVYVVTNCGFFEGRQCSILLEQMALWCGKTGLSYGGGLGVGAGEMLGIIRLTNLIISPAIALIVYAAVFLSGSSAHSAAVSAAITAGISIGLYLLWSSGLFIHTAILGTKIKKRESCKNRYTTVWFCGRPLFELFANLFWLIRAAGNGVPPWKMR